MIEIKIKEVAKSKGITTAYQLQKAADVSPSMAAKWFDNDLKSIGISTLDLLCKVFECGVNDLLVYTDDK